MSSGRILVATDVRLRRAQDGSVLSTHPAALYEAFAPLTRVYGAVSLFAREASMELPTVGEAGGPGVDLVTVPNFSSRATLAAALPRILWGAWVAVGRHDVVMGRLPEPLSLLVGWAAVLRRRQFVANVVADPTTVDLGRGRIARLGATLVLAATRALVRRASATIYVTQSYLQSTCPPPDRPTLVRSNVRIDDSWFRPPRDRFRSHQPRIVLVGSNQSWSKGQRVLLEAASLLAQDGRTVDLTFVGGGRHVRDIRTESERLGLPGKVEVLGQVESRERLGAILDEHDVFALPSLGEGLPRAMVEAMARGLPAVGTRVGGVPELLSEDAVAEPGDAASLASALMRVMDDPDPAKRSAAAVATAARVADQAQPERLEGFLRALEEARVGSAHRPA